MTDPSLNPQLTQQTNNNTTDPQFNTQPTMATNDNTTEPSSNPQLTRKTNDDMVKGNVRYLPTSEAYDLWSEVYDTDGNFLQALDTIEMQTLLPEAISQLPPPLPPSSSSTLQTKAVDLGCGTGRNTLSLLETNKFTTIIGLELSPKMMEIARQRCSSRLTQPLIPSQKTQTQTQLHFSTFDMLTSSAPPLTTSADLVISTLVLEHVPLPIFFHTCASMLRIGGILLLTNMHAEMGRISQAGFVDPRTGEKVRPQSYAHGTKETVEEAGKAGFEVVGSVKEVGVDEGMMGRLGVRSGKWIGVRVWFGGVWRRVR